MAHMQDLNFIIACGGKSTRNYPQSNGLAHKALLPFGSYRLIDHILKDIINAGGKNISIVCSDQETCHAFKQALFTDKKIRKKLEKKGRKDITDVIDMVKIPEDVNINYIIQEKPLGTAHVLAIANKLVNNKHGVLVFPDDVFISENHKNTHMKKMLKIFLKDDKKIVMTGIKQSKKDIHNYGVFQEGRFVEKPKNPKTNIGLFSPFIVPKEIMNYIEGLESSFVEEGKEWVYNDALNYFLDNHENRSEYGVDIVVKDNEDLYMDTGSRPLYEKALLHSLLTLSVDREEHIKAAKKILKKIIEN